MSHSVPKNRHPENFNFSCCFLVSFYKNFTHQQLANSQVILVYPRHRASSFQFFRTIDPTQDKPCLQQSENERFRIQNYYNWYVPIKYPKTIGPGMKEKQHSKNSENPIATGLSSGSTHRKWISVFPALPVAPINLWMHWMMMNSINAWLQSTVQGPSTIGPPLDTQLQSLNI